MSENIVKYYSIHDLINIKVNTSKKMMGNTVFNNPLSYFETTKDIRPDIEVNIGDFTPKKENSYIIDHKYYVDYDYIYFEDNDKSTQWKVEINGLENSFITVNFSGSVFGIYKYLVPDILYYEVALKPLIELLLGLKGYFLAHAGALSKDGESTLFFGMPGSLKSTIILNGVKNGFKTLGDDKVIIDTKSDSVYSFPVYPHIFDYTVNLGKEELSFLQKLRFLYMHNTENYSNFWDDSNNHVDNAFILKRVNKKGPLKTKLLENSTALNKIMKNNMNEMYISTYNSLISKNNFSNYLLAYSYAFPEGKLSNYWNNLKNELKPRFKDIEFYEIEIPLNYDGISLNEILDMVGE